MSLPLVILLSGIAVVIIAVCLIKLSDLIDNEVSNPFDD